MVSKVFAIKDHKFFNVIFCENKYESVHNTNSLFALTYLDQRQCSCHVCYGASEIRYRYFWLTALASLDNVGQLSTVNVMELQSIVMLLA